MKKKDMSIVRSNMMEDKYYRPYCGSVFTNHPNHKTCSSPRTNWSEVHSQMMCPECKWVSEFPAEFIEEYKAKHNL